MGTCSLKHAILASTQSWHLGKHIRCDEVIRIGEIRFINDRLFKNGGDWPVFVFLAFCIQDYPCSWDDSDGDLLSVCVFLKKHLVRFLLKNRIGPRIVKNLV